VYLKVSPFFFADKLKTPLSSSTARKTPIPVLRHCNSNKLYEAIRGNGGTARLVVLPHEPHLYTQWSRTNRWFTRCFAGLINM
jgi:hypothetical protein